MNEYQRLVDELYKAKLEKYKLTSEMMTEELQNEIYGEAVKEALTQYASVKV